MNRTVVFLLAILLAASGCSGSAPVEDSQSPQQSEAKPAGPLFDAGARLEVMRNTSGAPIGVILDWQSVDDTATSGPYITGYRIYKSDTAIPDEARGDDSLWLTIGSENIFPQPAVPGDPVGPLFDLFAAEYGQTWYYRLSAVAEDGDESRLSPQTEVLISQFEITSVDPASLQVGHNFTVSGTNFGTYDMATDEVQVRGVEWIDNVGFADALLTAPLLTGQWTSTQIVAMLPLGATTGPVDVTIDEMTKTSVDEITNSDPYLTFLDPLAGSVLDTITVRGANFGSGPGPDNYLQFDDDPMLDPANYVSYTDTEIVFTPPALHSYRRYQLTAHANGRGSNSAYFTIENAPPVAYLTGTPASGEAPLDVVFRPARLIAPGEWEYSYDPENSLVVYRYDFDGDGNNDEFRDTPDDVNFTYADPGEYTARLTIQDDGGLTATAEFVVQVSGPPLELTLLSGPSPGQYFADTSALAVRYSIAGGTPPVDVDWILIDAKQPTNEYQLATDTGLVPGTQFRNFALDTSTDVVTPGSGVIPLGSWQIRAEGSDADPFNDPDGSFELPVDATGGLGQLDVYRLDVGVISDDQADPDGSEGTNFLNLLNSKGYLVTYYPSSGSIDPVQAAGHHAVIWATAGPFGTSLPFEWLGIDEQIVIVAIEDLGGNVIIFGLPNVPSFSNPVFGFPVFNDLYQPFSSVDVGIGPQSLLTQDYTTSGAFGDYLVTGFDTGLELGTCFEPLLFAGSTSQSSFSQGPDAFAVAASRPSPAGNARLYFGMYIFSEASTLLPAGAAPEELLDNIVTGTAF